jgi:inosine-uridine nucleoside N-ribohydrolase
MPDPMPPARRTRVIVNTDAKNEADDQFAIVHALLTPMFELHGLIPAHFGTQKSATSLQDSHDEVLLLLRLMGLEGKVQVALGAAAAIPDTTTPARSAGAELIVAQALKDDTRPLHVAFLGPLTDMASALLMAPEIARRNVRVIWTGGGYWPVGNREYNLSNDIAAASVVARSGIEIWQIPMKVYRHMAVSYAELHERVHGQGEIGKYLVEQTVAWNERMVAEPIEHRSLGDSPAIGVMMYPECGESEWVAGPEYNELMNYVHTGRNRPVKLYHNVDQRFILEDMFAKLARFARGEQAFATFT